MVQKGLERILRDMKKLNDYVLHQEIFSLECITFCEGYDYGNPLSTMPTSNWLVIKYGIEVKSSQAFVPGLETLVLVKVSLKQFHVFL